MYTDIKVGYSCNNRCRHCVVEPARLQRVQQSRTPDCTTEEVKGHIDDARARNARAIVLTGGEVTLRPDFPLIISHALASGMDVTVQTNGRHLARWDELGVLDGVSASFVVAVHGPGPAIHDTVTRVDGSYDETIQGIHALGRHGGISITAKIVISRHNMNCLRQTLESMNSMGVSSVAIAFPHAEDFDDLTFAQVVPRYPELLPELAACVAFIEQSDQRVVFETIPYCVAPGLAGVWTRSLDAMLCVENEASQSVIQAANDCELIDWSRQRLLSKQKMPQCVECVFDRVCEGPWSEYVAVYGAGEFRPLTGTQHRDLLDTP